MKNGASYPVLGEEGPWGQTLETSQCFQESDMIAISITLTSVSHCIRLPQEEVWPWMKPIQSVSTIVPSADRISKEGYGLKFFSQGSLASWIEGLLPGVPSSWGKRFPFPKQGVSRALQHPPHLENDFRGVELSFSGADIVKVINIYSAIHAFYCINYNIYDV